MSLDGLTSQLVFAHFRGKATPPFGRFPAPPAPGARREDGPGQPSSTDGLAIFPWPWQVCLRAIKVWPTCGFRSALTG